LNSDTGGSEFLKAVEPILRKFVENIDNPFVWMPLGLFILCVLVYPITKFKVFPYLAIAFIVFAFGADWVGRWQNRQTPPEPNPQTSSYRNDVFTYLASVQRKAVDMLVAGKAEAARELTNKNLHAVDTALKSFPEDADFHALLGYTLKDVYQSSKNLLSPEQRKAYLSRARSSFEWALQLDPKNASAHNGMGNVLFFEGDFDAAIKEHDTALRLTDGNYPQAEHDRRIVIAVKNGEIPFDF
jgi:tetratricopeptide (TPR) repeat protein